MKPIRWHGEWIIGAPRDEVYRLMTDFENWSRLMPGIVRSARVVSRTDESVILHGEFNLLGRKGRGVMNIRLDPPNGFDADNTSEELGNERETVRLESIPEGTLYKWVVEPEPKGFFSKAFGRFGGRVVRAFYGRTIIKPLESALRAKTQP